MIIYASLLRISDGMPLSATNLFEKCGENKVQDARKLSKLVAKYIQKYPSKLCVEAEELTAHSINAENTCYTLVCEPSYPYILAYSFLDELMKEFSLLYTPSVVKAAKRPFGFIEFDSFLHKVQQKYNSPRALTTRLNLADMSNDLNMNPPVHVKLHELEPLPNVNGVSRNSHTSVAIGADLNKSNGLGLNKDINSIPSSKVDENLVFQLKPLSWYGRFALIFAIPFLFLSGYRGVVSLSSSYSAEDEGPSLLHALTFLLESVIFALQMHCLRSYVSRRKLITTLGFLFILFSNVVLLDVRDPVVVVFYCCASFGLTLATFRRNFCQGLPRFNI